MRNIQQLGCIGNTQKLVIFKSSSSCIISELFLIQLDEIPVPQNQMEVICFELKVNNSSIGSISTEYGISGLSPIIPHNGSIYLSEGDTLTLEITGDFVSPVIKDMALILDYT